MTKEAAEIVLLDWPRYSHLIFKLVRHLAPDEYLAIYNSDEDIFRVNADESTYPHPHMTKAELIEKIMSEELVMAGYHSEGGCLYRKTNGCVCGAWTISSVTPDMHSRFCLCRYKSK